MTLEFRSRIRRGGLRGADLATWLASLPPGERDAAFERLLGIDDVAPQPSLGEDRMGYMPSGIAPVVRAILDAPIGPGDVFVDLGSGLGKVAMAVHLLTGARARGVELQPDLAARARALAHDLGLDVAFTEGDALGADLDDATVFFLYLPFTGEVLRRVLERIRAVAEKRPIVVCSLGLDLRPGDWLVERPMREFWLAIYDTRIAGVPARAAQAPPAWAATAENIARER